MLKLELPCVLRYAFDMSGDEFADWVGWQADSEQEEEALLVEVSDQEEGQGSSEEEPVLSTARADDMLGKSGTTAVPKTRRQVEEDSLVETLHCDVVRERLLGQSEKPQQSKVMSSRGQPHKGSYSRQSDMPRDFQTIHTRATDFLL